MPLLQCAKVLQNKIWSACKQSDLACKHLVIVARFNVQLARQNADLTITELKKQTNDFLSAIIRDETRNGSIVATVPRLTVYNNSFVWFVVTSLIWNRSPRSSFLHDPQCVTFPHEKSQSICVSVVAELFNGVRNELALLLGRANNLWILQVPRNVFCPLDRSVSHSLRAG